MKKLSTGQDSTLGNYRKNAAAFFGEECEAVRWLDGQIEKSKGGEDEEVIQDEGQMIFSLMMMNKGPEPKEI